MREINLPYSDLSELSNELLSQGGSFSFKAQGSSMYPFIRDGDIITVKPVDGIGLKNGDIVFFSSAVDRVLVHRVVKNKIQDGRIVLLTRGDSMHSNDGWMPSEHVLGKVVSLKRGKRIIPLERALFRWGARFWVMIHPLGALGIRLAIELRKLIYFPIGMR